MNSNPNAPDTRRRGFLGTLAAGAATLGLSTLINPFKSAAALAPAGGTTPAEIWMNKIKGTHKVVFDATHPHEVMPFAWPKVFQLTNEKTGVPASECGIVVVLRHAAICYAFDNKTWADYKFGEVFEAPDPVTKEKVATRNPFWQPKPGDFKLPGMGAVPIGINELQSTGVMFCVCEMAMTVYSAVVAEGAGKKPEEVRAAWMAGLLPGIQPVPSGVWALGRTQEKGCAYVFAG